MRFSTASVGIGPSNLATGSPRCADRVATPPRFKRKVPPQCGVPHSPVTAVLLRRPPERVADRLLGEEGLGRRVLAERLAQDRQVRRLVAEDCGGGLGEVAVAEQRNRTNISAHGALFEAGREAQHVYLGFQRLNRKLVVGGLLRLDRRAAERL